MRNWQPLQKEIIQWSKRDISPIYKIIIIKSLLLSKLSHLPRPRPVASWIKRLETLFLKFIWGGKTDKITRKTMQMDGERERRMININIFIKSLKLTWIRRLLIKDSEWSNLITETTHCKITHLFQCGADYPRQKAHFAELISIVQHENTQTLFETLWYNDKIQIQNKSGFFYKTMYENGFYLISDLLDKKWRLNEV